MQPPASLYNCPLHPFFQDWWVFNNFTFLVILVPWGCAPSAQHHEARPLGSSNFQSMHREVILYSRTIRSSDLILNMPRVTRSLWIVDFWCGTFQEVVIWLLVLIKRNTASRDKSTSWLEKNNTILQWREMFLPPLNGIKSVV